VRAEQLTIALEMIDAIEVQIGRSIWRCRPMPASILDVGRLIDPDLWDRPTDVGRDRRRARDTRVSELARMPSGYAGPGHHRSTSPTPDARPGHLSRQGPPALRWALYEAAQPRRQAAPTGPLDQLAARIGRKPRVRRVARSCSNEATTFCRLGDQALEPIAI